LIPDLRRSPVLADSQAWATIVLDGPLEDRGMVGFEDVLTADEAESIRLYVIKRANEDKTLGEQ
jgi:alcohol dehydrogenase (cytochrome c)/quinohemoprotein ethanol dehydrogenase